jgi:hypothetical protein
VKVSVFVSAEAHSTLESRPRHVNARGEEEAGPARVTVKRLNGELQASIFVGNKVDQLNVDNIVGHELDEIADILYRRPEASEAEIAAEMQASVFRQDTVAGAKPTAHDRAQAAEYLTVVGQLAEYRREVDRLESKVTPTARDREMLEIARRGFEEREKNVKEMSKVMGLDLPEHAAEKLSLLRTVSRESGTMSRASDHQREAWSAELIQRSTKYAKSRYPEAFTGSMPDHRVAHVIMPEPHSALGAPGAFRESGLKGGHQDAELHRFVDEHPELGYRLEQDGPEKVVDGVTYRKYKQFLMTPSGEIQHGEPKTTTTDAAKLVADGQTVFAGWLRTTGGSTLKTEKGMPWKGATAEGIAISGYAQIVDGRPQITSIFVEASWIQ